MPQLDPTHFPSQLFWLCTIFGLLYVCLQFWIVPKLKKGLNARHNYLDHKLNEISSFQKKIERLERKREGLVQKKNQEIAAQLEQSRTTHQALLEKEQKKLKEALKEAQQVFDATLKEKADLVLEELSTHKQDLVSLVISQMSAPTTNKKDKHHD